MLDQRQLTRFRNEARAAAALHHNNIVPVFSVGCERGVHYYAMQLVEGQTLAQVIAVLRADDVVVGMVAVFAEKLIEKVRRSYPLVFVVTLESLEYELWIDSHRF
jgi:hypothetical protein